MEELKDQIMQWEYHAERERLIMQGADDADLSLITPDSVYKKLVQRETRAAYWKAHRDQLARTVAKAIKKGQSLDAGVNMVREIEFRPIGRWLFITVNSRDGAYLQQIMNRINKWVCRKAVLSAMWSFEQRSRNEEELGKGIHVHMLMRNGWQQRSQFDKNIKSTFGGICDVNNPAILNYKVVKQEHITNRINYLTGDKKLTGEKAEMMKMDKLWRQKEGMKPYYNSDNWDTIIAQEGLHDQDSSSDSDAE